MTDFRFLSISLYFSSPIPNQNAVLLPHLMKSNFAERCQTFFFIENFRLMNPCFLNSHFCFDTFYCVVIIMQLLHPSLFGRPAHVLSHQPSALQTCPLQPGSSYSQAVA
ncbi:hypothetical protein BDE02_01G364900 [Populus trichocarpa]|nr:hypothetical protein BDE02_01G364900 [Populus trichocarpa]